MDTKKIRIRFSGRYIEGFDEIRVSLMLVVEEDTGKILSIYNEEVRRGIDKEKFARFLKSVKELDKSLFYKLVSDLLFWASCTSLIKKGEFIALPVYNFFRDIINNVDDYKSLSAAELLLDPISPSLVGGLVFVGLLRPADAFAELPPDAREKVAEGIWDQKLVAEYDKEGNPVAYKYKKMVYISYRISVPSFPNPISAVRCICPSTGQTHWLLIPDFLVDRPKDAIAWTCLIPIELYEYGRYYIKRQGDVFLFELQDDLPDDQVAAMMASRLIHHPAEDFWARYIDEA